LTVARGVGNLFRLAAVALVGAVLAFQIVRTAAVADREARPGLAVRLWPSHPGVLTDRALLAIATAGARSDTVSPATRAEVRRIASKAPLSPDPYLIEGAIAQTEGRDQAAERLLLAARDRDPRSRGARFLLADRFLRTGRVTDALIEMHALVSLQSRGAETFGPVLAAYARTPEAIPKLRAFFVKYPRVEAGVLSVLANDAANADLVLALAANDGIPDPDWRGTLVSALASAGLYPKAYTTWARLSGVRPAGGLFNPEFRDLPAPPPFNWALPQGSEGVAEPDGKGGLAVLYYGRANAVLASQLLLLQPGNYRLGTSVEGAGGDGAIHWVLRCAEGQKTLADIRLRPGAVSGGFTVPAGCQAQWLELQGIAADTPAITDLTIRGLRLEGGRP
jgi:hypothetical protein